MRSDQTPELVRRMRELLAPMEPVPTLVEPALTTLLGVEAVLFDVYGTLLISSSGDVGTSQRTDNHSALREALAACGGQGDLDRAAEHGLVLFHELIREEHESSQAYGRRFPEVEIRDIWTKVSVRLDAKGMLAPLRPAAIERLAIEYECRTNPVWPMPGLTAALDWFRRSGRPMGIVSNAQFYTPLLFQAVMRTDLESLGFSPPLCAWSWRIRQAKPAAAIFAPVVAELAHLGISPHQVVFVGNDMLNDIWTATQAGLRTILFAGDQRSLRRRSEDPRCARLQPSAVLTDLRQFADVLPEWALPSPPR